MNTFKTLPLYAIFTSPYFDLVFTKISDTKGASITHGPAFVDEPPEEFEPDHPVTRFAKEQVMDYLWSMSTILLRAWYTDQPKVLDDLPKEGKKPVKYFVVASATNSYMVPLEKLIQIAGYNVEVVYGTYRHTLERALAESKDYEVRLVVFTMNQSMAAIWAYSIRTFCPPCAKGAVIVYHSSLASSPWFRLPDEATEAGIQVMEYRDFAKSLEKSV